MNSRSRFTNLISPSFSCTSTDFECNRTFELGAHYPVCHTLILPAFARHKRGFSRLLLRHEYLNLSTSSLTRDLVQNPGHEVRLSTYVDISDSLSKLCVRSLNDVVHEIAVRGGRRDSNGHLQQRFEHVTRVFIPLISRSVPRGLGEGGLRLDQFDRHERVLPIPHPQRMTFQQDLSQKLSGCYDDDDWEERSRRETRGFTHTHFMPFAVQDLKDCVSIYLKASSFMENESRMTLLYVLTHHHKRD